LLPAARLQQQACGRRRPEDRESFEATRGQKETVREFFPVYRQELAAVRFFFAA
jgi:hypothetical protein